MTKANSLELASVLTLGQLSADRLAPFYDESIYALGALPYLFNLWLVTREMTARAVFPAQPGDSFPYVTSDGEPVFPALPGDIYPYRTLGGVGVIFTAPGDPLGSPYKTVIVLAEGVYAFPASALTLYEIWYEDRGLDMMTHDELNALAVQWQEQRGSPMAYSVDNVSLREFKLYPTPVIPGDPLLMLHFGGAFGIDYPSGNAVLLATQFLLDIPSWLELPLIYMILAREYALESDHQDTDFARGCAQIGTLLFSMLQLAPIL